MDDSKTYMWLTLLAFGLFVLGLTFAFLHLGLYIGEDSIEVPTNLFE